MKWRAHAVRGPCLRSRTIEIVDTCKCEAPPKLKRAQTLEFIRIIQRDVWTEPDRCITPFQRLCQNLLRGMATYRRPGNINDAVGATLVRIAFRDRGGALTNIRHRGDRRA